MSLPSMVMKILMRDDSILGSDIPDLVATGHEITAPTDFLANLDIALDHDFETDFHLLVSFALQCR